MLSSILVEFPQRIHFLIKNEIFNLEKASLRRSSIKDLRYKSKKSVDSLLVLIALLITCLSIALLC
jgi:hypothetical protein